jgi:hypothetical protein
MAKIVLFVEKKCDNSANNSTVGISTFPNFWWTDGGARVARGALLCYDDDDDDMLSTKTPR